MVAVQSIYQDYWANQTAEIINLENKLSMNDNSKLIGYTDNQSYNTMAIPLGIAFVQFCYIFVSVFKKGFFFEKTIISSAFVILLIWLILFLVKNIKDKIKIFKIIFSLIIGLVLGFYYVKKSYFSGYLTLNPIGKILSNNFHPDTLFHASVAESFFSNQSPAYNYHILSHFIVSVISRFLALPCILTYNYLFHIGFIPLYVYLIQSVVIDFRKKVFHEKTSYYSDIIFLMCFCFGFNFCGICDNASCFYNSIIISESCLCSVVIMLLAMKLFFSVNNQSKKNRIIMMYIVIPIFIFLATVSKVSTGFIMLVIYYFYCFRKSTGKKSVWIAMVICLIVFFVAFILFTRSGDLWYVLHLNSDNVNLFAFAEKYIKKQFLLFHYCFYLLPSFLIGKYYKKGKMVSKVYFSHCENIIFEICFVSVFVSFLPGLFMNISGGSAGYFTLTAYVFNIEILFGLGICQKIFTKNSWRKCVIMITLAVCLFYPTFIDMDIFHTANSTLVQSNLETILKNDKYGFSKLKYCFADSDYLEKEQYKTFMNVSEFLNKHRNESCLLVLENSFFSNSANSYFGVKQIKSEEEFYKIDRKYLIVLEQNTFFIREQ